MMKFIKGAVLVSILLFINYFICQSVLLYAFETSDEYNVEDVQSLLSSEDLIEIFNEDGTMEMRENFINYDEVQQEMNSKSLNTNTNFVEVKIIDSGKPDSESIVLTFMVL